MWNPVAFPSSKQFSSLHANISLVLSLLIFLVLGSGSAAWAQTGQTISVANGDVAGLITSINTLNGSGGGFILLAPGGSYVVTAPSYWWYGPDAFPAIQSSIYIEGNGATISRQTGSGNFRFFYVSGGLSSIPGGTLTLHNLTLENGLAEGGSGGNGGSPGGGGAGMGGVVFNQGTLNLVDVLLAQNTAEGGAGGTNSCGGDGGGGGLGGNGGGCADLAGGGGFRYNGSTSCNCNGANGGGGGFMGGEGGNSGDISVFFGGTAAGGSSSYGGNGGNGNYSPNHGGGGGGFSIGENGGTPGAAIGGGAGGNNTGIQQGSGGGGGAFGGGGAAGYAGGNGGGGGVGGGGGAGYNGFYGGSGGFGGGAGGAGGSAGFGGGADGTGGNGLGGAVFSHTGTVVLVRTTATGNAAQGGTAGSSGTAAPGLGGVLFDVNGNVTIEDSSIAGSGGNTADTQGNSVYVLSSNQGNTASGQTPASSLQQTVDNLSTDLVTSQVNGTISSTVPDLSEVTVSQPVYDFGTVPLNTVSSPKTFTVTNTGTVALTINSIQAPTGFTVQDESNCTSVAPQTACTFTVTFEPTATVTTYGVVVLSDDAPESMQAIFLSGAGGETQTITFPQIADQSVGAAPFTLSATASSGLAVTFAAAPSTVCTVSGSTMTMVGSGTCNVVASQAGDSTWAAASASQSFQVLPLSQTITFPAIATQVMSTVSITLNATASSNLTVSYASLTPSVCTTGGNTVTLETVGLCTVEASQIGNTIYSAATPVDQSFQINLATQTVQFGNDVYYDPIGNRVVNSTAFPLYGASSSGLPITYASTSSACTVSGRQVSAVGTGPCSITASQAGNNVYSPAQATQTFSVIATPPVFSVANGDVAGLIAAIQSINVAGIGYIELAAGGAYSISAPSDWWYGPDAFPAIQSAVYIEGNGATIARAVGSPVFRFFYVAGGFSTVAQGTLTLHNMTLQNGLAQGGRGGDGESTGGGGGGLGGGAFNQGVLNLVDVHLVQDTAQGGRGGLATCGGNGGGGGLGGNGGDGCNNDPQNSYEYVGGGGGFRYGGANAGVNYANGGGFLGIEGAGGSGGGVSPYGGNGGGGEAQPEVAAGGGGGFSQGENGGTPGAAIGGGSGGVESGIAGPLSGGGGAFGGGAAGGEGSGGGGGVGGGGGAAEYVAGGGGGFGGGGGGSGIYVSGGGFGGGQGSFYGYVGSGGGSGLGGAVFNHIGSTVLVRTTANTNDAAGGAAGNELNGNVGPAGSSLGSIVFDLNGAVTMEDSSLSSLANTASSGSVYVESSNQGVIASGQTPTASFVQQTGAVPLAPPDLVTNQVDGTTTSTTASMPEVTIQPAALSFDASSVGVTTAPMSVTIGNTGSSTLTFSSISVVGDFSLQNTCGPIAPNGTCTLQVVFSPTAMGVAHGVVILSDNAPEATQAIFLNGGIGAPTPVVPYIQVNGGAWQQVASVAVNVGDTVNLAGQVQSTGTWNWTGPNSFNASGRVLNAVSLPSASNVYTLTYTNAAAVASTQAFTITVNPTPVVPYIQVNGGAWQQISSVTVNAGDTVNLTGQSQSTGSWSWTGPNSFTASGRVLNAVSLPSATNVYNLTYTNAAGVASSPQAFTITVNSTPVVPYIQVNGGAWQQVASVAVNVGDTVNLAGQVQSTGTWNWTGPNSFSASGRVLNAVSLPSATNVYTLTYTNALGVAGSPQAFTITVNSTPVVPYIQVNGGAWRQVSSITVNAGDTVNLAGQVQSTGTWNWTGPNSFSASGRVLNAVSLPSATNVYNLTYTNALGVAGSPQAFTITVNPTPVVPYIEVNGGAWQQISSVTVNASDTVNLAGQVQSTGSWSWTGTNNFTASGRVINAVSLPSATNVYNLTYTNALGVAGSPQAFTITVNSTPVVPYIQVNGGAWQQVASVAVNVGDTVNLAGQVQSTGSWSWTGTNNFSASGRVLNAVSLPSATNVYNLTYTNAAGVAGTPQAFTITVNPTPVVPYIQVNGGAWRQVSSVTVNAGDTVNLAGQVLSGGSWSWIGPNSFTANTRDIYAVPLTTGANVFTLTYTNTSGVNSTQTFTITVN